MSYGDIIPGSDAVRALAMVEAVTGQFYIVVLVATLVGQHVAQATGSGSAGDGAPADRV